MKALLGVLLALSAASLVACVDDAPPQTAALQIVKFRPDDLLVPPSSPVIPRKKQTGEYLVLLLVLVDSAGRPTQVTVAKSSGDQEVDQKVVASMSVARFRPYAPDGKAQAVWISMPIKLAFPLIPLKSYR